MCPSCIFEVALLGPCQSPIIMAGAEMVTIILKCPITKSMQQVITTMFHCLISYLKSQNFNGK